MVVQLDYTIVRYGKLKLNIIRLVLILVYRKVYQSSVNEKETLDRQVWEMRRQRSYQKINNQHLERYTHVVPFI